MKKVIQSSPQHQSLSIERPLTSAPYVLMGERLMMVPLMPDHGHKLFAEIFSQPQIMKYLRQGAHFTWDAYNTFHLDLVQQNMYPVYDQYTGHLSKFTWAIITRDGIGGQLEIHPEEGRTALGYCISPTQQGRALARRASELFISHAGERSLIATAHPKNTASLKTLEQLQYPDRTFVLFKDPNRQNVPNVYGENQSRNYFLSKESKENPFSFFSFRRGPVQVNVAEELTMK